MRKHLLHSVAIGVGILGLAATAQAEQQQSGLTANVGITTNYVFRGQTQTDDDPAIQGGIDFNHSSGFYAGAWGSNVKFRGLGSSLEYDLYAGFNFNVSQDFKVDVGYIAYNYTDSTVDDSVGSSEVFVGAKFQNFAAYYYNGNPKTGSNDLQYIDLRYTMVLPQDFKATLHYGHADYHLSKDADDIGIRVSKDISGFDLGLAFTRVDPDQYTNDAKNRLFLSVSKSFDL